MSKSKAILKTNSKTKSSKPKYPWLKNYPKNISWSKKVPELPMGTLIDTAVQSYGTQNCIDFLGKKYTYIQVNTLINKTAKGLQGIGVKKGQKIGLFLPNSPYFIIFYFAILKIGAVVVNFNPLYVKREIIHQVKDSETEIMVTLDLKLLYDKLDDLRTEAGLKKIIVCSMTDILPFFKSLLFKLFKSKELATIKPSKHTLHFDELTQNQGDFKPAKIDPKKDLAVLQYTGGTTGVPKGAMLTHGNLYANTEQAFLWFTGVQIGQEKMLGVIPLFHVFAMTGVMNLGIRVGAEIILLPRFEINELLRTIEKKRPTLMPAVPTIFTAINNHRKTPSMDLSSLQRCISGGAPLPLEVKNKFEKITKGFLVEGYGLSETSPVAAVHPMSLPYHEGSIGFPMPNTIIDIVSIDDGKTPLKQGERGEVCIKGPQVMLGYWNKPEETKKAIRNGRFHTGDVGYIDQEGYLYIVDRIKDLILAGGFNVYPRNVEEAIYLHPAIKECIVAGVPDEYRGQTVKAYIVVKENQSLKEDSLREFLKDKLSPIEIPKSYEFRQELPKTMIGKLSRKDVLDQELKKKAS